MSQHYKVAGIFSPTDTDNLDSVLETLRSSYSFDVIGTKKGKSLVLKDNGSISAVVTEDTDGVFNGASREVNGNNIIAFINVTKAFTVAKVLKKIKLHRWDTSTIPDKLTGELTPVIRLLLPV